MGLPLFVYGTLQRGCLAHRRYCRRAQFLGHASVRGALFEHDGNFPVLVVAARQVLASGTADASTDALALPRPGSTPRVLAIASKARRIEGEVLLLPWASALLAELDRYEGYTPGRPSLFARVLLDVELSGRGRSRAWTYVAGALMRPEALTPFDGRRWRPA